MHLFYKNIICSHFIFSIFILIFVICILLKNSSVFFHIDGSTSLKWRYKKTLIKIVWRSSYFYTSCFWVFQQLISIFVYIISNKWNVLSICWRVWSLLTSQWIFQSFVFLINLTAYNIRCKSRKSEVHSIPDILSVFYSIFNVRGFIAIFQGVFVGDVMASLRYLSFFRLWNL